MDIGNSPLIHLSASKSKRKISLLKEMRAVTQSNNENSTWGWHLTCNHFALWTADRKHLLSRGWNEMKLGAGPMFLVDCKIPCSSQFVSLTESHLKRMKMAVTTSDQIWKRGPCTFRMPANWLRSCSLRVSGLVLSPWPIPWVPAPRAQTFSHSVSTLPSLSSSVALFGI